MVPRELNDIREWLSRLGLAQYADTFAREAIDLDILPSLTESHLRSLGIPLGHRLKILKAASASQTNRSKPAERRQITVMFCDLVGSTALSAQLDPEDLRDVMRSYQSAAGAVIESYGGYVAQYLGDGLMVYFGWPHAHEDDAERAVRSGLDVVEAVRGLGAPADLAVRVGIATGLVVVGHTATDTAMPNTAVGETPNAAARIQSLAAAHQVAIAQTTHRLIGNRFSCADLGEHALKGWTQPQRVWRVLGEHADSDSAMSGGRTMPMFGRHQERTLLRDSWHQAKSGTGRAVIVSGEPGIGKTRLLQDLKDSVQGEANLILRYYGSRYHQDSPFYMISREMAAAAQIRPDDPPETKLNKLDTYLDAVGVSVRDVAPLFATALSVPTGQRYPPLAISAQEQRQRTAEQLADGLMAATTHGPVLFLLEDAQWADPSSLDTLSLILRRMADAPILVVITHRPEFAPPWPAQDHVSHISLSRLGNADDRRIIEAVAGGRALPEQFVDIILEKTDGVPLYVEEMTRTVLDSDLFRDVGDSYVWDGPLPAFAVPASLQDSFMARLDRLGPAKDVAQVGAVIGRVFPYRILTAVANVAPRELDAALAHLRDAGLIHQHGPQSDVSYVFKHALLQDAAYASLLKARRQQIHARVAYVIENQFGAIVISEPELLARHLTEARMPERAARYWLRAGQNAAERSALVEARRHCQAGLDAIRTAPHGAVRQQLEQDLSATLAQIRARTAPADSRASTL